MRHLGWAFVLCLASPAVAWAGMPMPRLNDVVRLRLENISFFLAGFLLSAFLIQLLWNYLRRDWPALPRLNYPKALGLVTLWGLLFILVLTMISGARELMTPAAWDPDGATYKIAKKDQIAADEARDESRRRQLERLRDTLWDHARKNGDRFPAARTEPGITPAVWQLPDPSGLQYVYVGGTISRDKGIPLAYEPDLYGPERYVLFTDGSIGKRTLPQILEALPADRR